MLHSEKLHSFYRSPNVVRVVKSRRLRWEGHVIRVEEGRSSFKIVIEFLQERDHQEYLGDVEKVVSMRNSFLTRY
jgi:hypothetical protein